MPSTDSQLTAEVEAFLDQLSPEIIAELCDELAPVVADLEPRDRLMLALAQQRRQNPPTAAAAPLPPQHPALERFRRDDP
jgi:hypothetical protein